MNKQKPLLLLATTLLAASTLVPATYAATSKTKKPAPKPATSQSSKKPSTTQSSVKMVYNGQAVNTVLKPVLINNMPYIPVNMLSSLFNKNVDIDPKTRAVTVTDKPDTNVAALQDQLSQKETYLSTLQGQMTQKDSQLSQKEADLRAKDNKIADLEKKIADLDKKKETNLNDIEDKLIDRYKDYKNVQFDISLSGSKNSVRVNIDVDLDREKSDWNRLSSNDKKSYLQDIVDDIQNEYEDADVEGYIKDGSRELLSFDIDSRGNVRVNDNAKNINDIETQIASDYNDYWSDIDLDIQLSGDERNTDFKVNMDYHRYKAKWDNLSDSEVRRLMEKIYDEIQGQYPDSEIVGTIYDSYGRKNLAIYSVNSRGSVSFSRVAAY
jgi:hypothetical protein